MIKDINFNELGYLEALQEVFKIRLNRKPLYGDSWKEDSDFEILVQIKNKIGRLEKRIKSEIKEYENEIDCLIDIINYSLFLLQNKLDQKKK